MRPVDPRLLRHASAARPFIVAAAALGAAAAVLVITQADLLAGIVTRAFLGHATLAVLAAPFLGLAAVVLGRSTVALASEAAAHRAAARVLAQLRAKLVGHVLRVGPRDTAGRSPAELANLATRGVAGLDGYFARYLPQLLLAAIVPAAVGARILFADWVAAVIVAGTVPLIPVFMILIGLYTRRDVRRQWRTLSILANHFVDLVAGLAVLTAFGRAKEQTRAIREITDRYRGQTMKTLRVAFLSALVLDLLATLSVALVAVSIGLRLVSGQLDLHTALVVLILAPEVYLPLRAVGARFHDSAEGLAAAEEIFAVLDTESGTGAPGRVPAPNPARVPLRVDAVTVAGRSAPILDAVSVDIPAGRVLGVVGPSGAGKSTLLDLLLTWRHPDAGRITVGGVDLTEVDRRAWLARIAWVPQQPRLVAGTVAGNLRLGRPDATIAQLRAAADTAALDVPLDRVVGELGAGLSTGQQRRVALARALLADRPLLLLDEPTEGVDADTEAAILAALPAALAGRTAVIVTHRPAVLELCDQVVTLPGHPTSSPAPLPANETSEKSTVDGMVTGLPVAASPTPQVGPIRPWRWLAAAVRPYRGRLALATLAGAGALAAGVALTATSAWLIATAALHPPVLTLMVAIVAVRTFGIGKPVLRYLERLTSHDAALRVLVDLRVRVWQALVRLGPAVTARLRRGDLLTRLVSDVDTAQDVLVRGVVPAVSAAVVGVAVAGGIGMLLPSAGLTLLLGLLLAGVVAPAVTVLAGHAAERHTAALRAEVLAGTVELLQAAPDLVALGAAEARQKSLRDTDIRLTHALRGAALARGAGIGLATLAIGGTMIACTALGVLALGTGLAGPALAVLALTPLAAADLVLGLPDAAQRLLGAGHAARRLAALDRMPATSTEPAVPQPVPPSGTLSADRLSVRWPGAEADAVRDVTLAVRPARQLALTGPSGAGKSTVLAALMRDLDPSAGAVYLAGVDTAGCASDAVRARISWCGAETHLFDSTLRENLRLAAPGAADAALTEALRRVRLGAWFDALPGGLDTRLGAHGTGVSGGERQRLGLARALLADRPVLLLDEPTAHLDRPTAAALATDLLALTADRAAIIVTHRPADLAGVPVVSIGARQGSLVGSQSAGQ